MDAVVLQLVCEHLRLADAFRLRIALGRHADTLWLDDVPGGLCARMGLQRQQSMPSLSRHMQATRRRCIECGIVTACKPKVCHECAKDPTSSVAMLSRLDIRKRQQALPKAQRVRGLERILREQILRPAKMGRAHRLFYWKRDVDALFAAHSA